MSWKHPTATYLGTRYLTDGKVFGVVQVTDKDFVFIVDRDCGRHKLRASTVRRMTEEEIEQYNSEPAMIDPTPDEIADRSNQIQKGWTPEKRRKRSAVSKKIRKLFGGSNV